MIVFFYIVMLIHSEPVYDLSADGKVLTISGSGQIDHDTLTQKVSYQTINSVIIINGITDLLANSFKGCTNLNSVTFPDRLLSIGSASFQDCINLESIDIPEGVTELLDSTFFQCYNLKYVKFPDTLQKITNNYLFYGCNSLISFDISESNIFFSTDESKRFVMSKDKTIVYLTAGSYSSVKIPDSVEIISDFFMNGNTNAKTIEFSTESNLKEVGYVSFRQCKFTKITFPSKLSKIGIEPFQSSAIQEINFPISLTSISYQSLAAASDLQTVTFPDNCPAIIKMDGVIYNRAMTDLIFVPFNDNPTFVLPATVVNVSPSMFQSRKSIKKIEVENGNPSFKAFEGLLYNSDFSYIFAAPGGIESPTIHTNAQTVSGSSFKGTDVVSVDFSNTNLRTIADFAFTDCTKLSQITFVDSISTIGMYAFAYTSFENQHLNAPASLENLGIYAFSNSNLYTINFKDCSRLKSIPTYCFSNTPKFVATEFNPALTSIESNAFEYSGLRSITLKEGISNIAENAFLGSSSLSEVIFQCQLTRINSGVFSGCNIKSLNIPSSVQSFGNGCFKGNSELSTITFEEVSQLSSLEPRVFDGCDSLINITFGPNLKSIAQEAFAMCSNLQNIFVDSTELIDIDGILYSKENELIACPPGRESAYIKSSVKTIAKSAFFMCQKLVDLNFDQECKISTIPENTFYGCSALKSILIPNDIEILMRGSFNSCSSLANVTFNKDSKLTEIGDNSFSACTSLSSFVFTGNNMLKKIGISSFEDCIHLTNFVFSNNIESIGASAFKNCALTSVFLPESIQAIGASAFENNANLKSATYCGTNAFKSLNMFLGCPLKQVSVSFGYPADNFGGSKVGHIFDDDCNIPTSAFTINSSQENSAHALLVACVMCDDN